MGWFLKRKMQKGTPVAAVPHTFYNEVDEVLSKLEVYNGHIERNQTIWTIVLDSLGSESNPLNSEQVVRGTKGLFKVILLRAYLTADDSLVAVDESYDEGTMYLYPTWDYPRAR